MELSEPEMKFTATRLEPVTLDMLMHVIEKQTLAIVHLQNQMNEIFTVVAKVGEEVSPALEALEGSFVLRAMGVTTLKGKKSHER